jgi:iron(III) transport system ATP-binding protein
MLFLSALRLTSRPRPRPSERVAEEVWVSGVTKSFGPRVVLTDVDLKVPAGSVVALLGPSGCGKTTLLRTIAGLEAPEAGIIRVGERLVFCPQAPIAPERRHIGMVFQDWALFPHLSVAGNVAFGLPRSERKSARVDEALEMVDLAGLSDRSPATLSGGQQQRVAIARALATRPSVILLDEPFSNLDATLRVQIRNEVQRLLRDLGVTTLFVTHDQEEAFAVGDSVAVMFDGRVVQQASPAELYEYPRSMAVAEFIGDPNFIDARAEDDTADSFLGVIPLAAPTRGDVRLMVRPEELIVHSGGDEAVIEDIEFYGHDAVYELRTNDGLRLRSRILAAPDLRPGERVGLKYSGKPTVAFPSSQ